MTWHCDLPKITKSSLDLYGDSKTKSPPLVLTKIGEVRGLYGKLYGKLWVGYLTYGWLPTFAWGSREVGLPQSIPLFLKLHHLKGLSRPMTFGSSPIPYSSAILYSHHPVFPRHLDLTMALNPCSFLSHSAVTFSAPIFSSP